jgi:hypothetical protein
MYRKGEKQMRLFLRELEVLGRRGKPVPGDLLDFMVDYAMRRGVVDSLIPSVDFGTPALEQEAAIKALLQRTLRRSGEDGGQSS